MSEEFIKPKKVNIDATSYITTLLADGIEKDLHDNEEICETCQGTGIVKDNNVYGLSDDPNKQAGRFPYKHQSIRFCPNCYNGVIHRCEHCGKIMPRSSGICVCDAASDARRQEEDKKLLEALRKAEEFESDALGSRFGMCYSEHYSHNDGYFSEWEEFFDSFEYEEDLPCPHPEYVWGTAEIEISMDADSIIENATDDFYEDASSEIGDAARAELQRFLNDWCLRCGMGKSYTWTTKYKVRIPWDTII